MMNGKEKDESFIVSNAVQYMQEHFREKITLPEVAEKIYVSQWHLSKLLNRHMGKNFSEVLNSIRIEKAKELMKDPSLRLADIAEMVGWATEVFAIVSSCACTYGDVDMPARFVSVLSDGMI